jgi:hypothetical protein
MNGIQLKTRRERSHDVADEIRALMDKFDQRLRLDNPRFVDRYIAGKLNILIKFAIREIREEFVADIQGHQQILGPRERNLIGSDFDSINSGSDGDKLAVFAGLVQFVKDEEIVTFPSVVRFKLEEIVSNDGINALYFSLTRGFVTLNRRFLRNREIDPRVSTSRILLQKESVGQVVKSPDQIEHDVPNGVRNVCWDIDDFLYVKDRFSSVRITLSTDSIRAVVEESAQGLIELRDVLFGPFDFAPNV